MLVIVLIVMLVTEGKKNRKAFEEEQKNTVQQATSDPLEAPIALNPMMKSENDYTFEEPTSTETEECRKAEPQIASSENGAFTEDAKSDMNCDDKSNINVQ